MIERSMTGILKEYISWFPIVALIGPRQSGKSTLVKQTFPTYDYIDLDDPTTFELVQSDPMGVLIHRKKHLIIDEAQRVPDLFKTIKVLSDNDSERSYVLSGSQNFLLMDNINESLAGRVGILTLLPLSYSELARAHKITSLENFICTGAYPRIYDKNIPSDFYYDSYIKTYLQRDVLALIREQNSQGFENFIKLCALNCSNLINLSSMASDLGITSATIRSWISILERSHIIFRLSPYFTNKRKQMIKTSKLYFYDTGLCSHILGISTADELEESEYKGALFENLVISETMKSYYNRSKEPRLSFYRDYKGKEIDLIDETEHLHPKVFEIKSSYTYRASFQKNLFDLSSRLGIEPLSTSILMRGDAVLDSDGFTVQPIQNYLEKLD